MDNNLPAFLDKIGKSDLKNSITSNTPWSYFTMELGLTGFSYAGGLGILAGDIYLQAANLNIPFTAFTLLYPVKWKQKLDNFTQSEDFENIAPEKLNLLKEKSVSIFANNDKVTIDVYSKKINNAKIFALFEPGLKELYFGATDCQHRLYQECVLSFGGMKVLKNENIDPSVIHLNESSTVFAALSYLDGLVFSGMTLDAALSKTREKTIFTNHTLLLAAVASFPKDFYLNYVFKNLESEKVKFWLDALIDKQNGHLNLSLLAFELSNHLNGVSILHTKIANNDFKKADGSRVEFKPVTNGIYLKRWAYKDFYDLLKSKEVIDKFDLVENDYKEKIEKIEEDEIIKIKNRAKIKLINSFHNRINQYNNVVSVPENAKIAVWARRFAEYKRPNMVLNDLTRLSQILQKYNIYLLFCGDMHPTGDSMKQELQKILSEISKSHTINIRVQFIQGYDAEFAKYLVEGADIWLNTPEIGKEACGTSWMKAMLNFSMLISTTDGGVADIPDATYLKIVGNNYKEELESLYENLDKAGEILKDKNKYSDFVKNQLKSYLPTIAGARMVKDYLNFISPSQ